jgi:glycosyltransferase 2 family protein
VNKKRFLLGLKVAISIGLVFWLVDRVDWQSVGSKIYNVSWPLLIVYVMLQLLGNVISSKKWQIIAGFKGLHFSVGDGFFAYLTGAFINNFLPSTLGGDAYRGLWLADRSGAKAASISTVVFDRFIGLWTTAMMALVACVPLIPLMSDNIPLAIAIAALVAFLVIDLTITYLYCCAWFRDAIARIPFHKVRRLLQEVIFYTKKHIWWRTSFWAFCFAFVGVGLSNFALFHAFGSDIGLGSFFSVIFLVTIVSSVPLSINNIGIKEWAYVTFFALIGVNAETAVTVALLSRFIQMFISFIALPKYWRSRNQ